MYMVSIFYLYYNNLQYIYDIYDNTIPYKEHELIDFDNDNDRQIQYPGSDDKPWWP